MLCQALTFPFAYGIPTPNLLLFIHCEANKKNRVLAYFSAQPSHKGLTSVVKLWSSPLYLWAWLALALSVCGLAFSAKKIGMPKDAQSLKFYTP